MSRLLRSLYLAVPMLLAVHAAGAGEVADRILRESVFRCGTITEPAEENKTDLHGPLNELSGQICHGIAAAALGDASQVNIREYASEAEGLTALKSGDSDVVVGVTPVLAARVRDGIDFGPSVFLDAQGFMVHRESGISTIADMAGRKVCFIDGTPNAERLQAAMSVRGVKVIPYDFQEEGEMDAALVVGHCDAMSANLSRLADVRAQFHAMVHDFRMLPETLNVHPAAVAYGAADARWGAMVDASVNALIEAEQIGMTKDNARAMEASTSRDPSLMHLIGTDWSSAAALGLPRDWAVREIEAVGNYGEIYDRTMGEHSALGLKRGLNALWTQGGLLHPTPVR